MAPDDLQWTRQLGTSGNEYGSGAATDTNGNIYVTGYTDGNLEGIHNSGSNDVFLSEYDANGNKLWSSQWGTSGYDYGRGVTIDINDNVYVAGDTVGSIDGNVNSGGFDIFLSKFPAQSKSNVNPSILMYLLY